MTAELVLAAPSTGEAIAFWVLGPLAVVAAVMMVLSHSAVHGALFLAGVMLSFAGLYAVQAAPFLAAVQVIVYTGAILMLFLFVLMLVGVDASDSLVETLRGQRLAAFVDDARVSRRFRKLQHVAGKLRHLRHQGRSVVLP